MFKKILVVILLLSFFLTPMFFIARKQSHAYANNENLYISVNTNDFTQKDEKQNNNVTIGSIGVQYEKVAENNHLSLYIDRNPFSIKIKNKVTGYVWNFNLENTEKERLNEEWQRFAKSLVVIYYYDTNFNKRQATIYDKNVNLSFDKIEDGVKANVDFKDIGISFDIYLRLNDDSLDVKVPYESIKDSKGSLASIELFPFLGAVKDGERNGYIFIPDGSGALIRFNKPVKEIDEPYVARIYGNDEAVSNTQENSKSNFINNLTNVSPKRIFIPVYGMIHNVGKDGYLAIIESGAEYANIVCYPAGVSTDFNWVTSEFVYRNKYFQPISKNMDGFLTYQKDKNRFDIKIKIAFLSNNEADYVGMAKRYQQDLINRGLLSPNIIDRNDRGIPLRIEFFGGEMKKGIIWNSIVVMTKVKQAEYILDDLKKSGIPNFLVIYKGITRGGYTGTLPQLFPFDERLGNYNDFKDFFDGKKVDDVQIASFTDFTTAYQGAGGYNPRTDIAYKINKRPIQFNKGKDLKDYFYLSPVAALKKFEMDRENFKKYNISSIAVNTTPSVLFSNFLEGRNVTRSQSIDIYKKLFKEMHKDFTSISLYAPNEYLFKYANNFLDIPMYSSQYTYETDTVPFLQIVLRGYVDLYAPISNYYADINEETLRMVEYGVYPSFLLTYMPSYMLIDTPSKNIISSRYYDLKDLIIRQYNKVNNALKYVKGEKIVSREILDDKVVKVDYSNGVSIIVNYKDKDYIYNGKTVQAKNYLILGGGLK